ncbi:MAG: phytoene/squalene synthase family protein [Luteimonas sp.]
MTDAATSTLASAAEHDGFIDKWRLRWPEWQVAEAFLPRANRKRWLAWFAVRQELIDAAWAGADPRPGEAKLGWWSEELQGWAQGRRRHPLGLGLQSLAAPWGQLATCLPALAAARGSAEIAALRTTLAPMATAIAMVDAVLAEPQVPAMQPAAAADAILSGLLAQRALLDEDSHLACELLAQWQSQRGERGERIVAALLHRRLRSRVTGSNPTLPPSHWQILAIAWRAARQQQSVSTA